MEAQINATSPPLICVDKRGEREDARFQPRAATTKRELLEWTATRTADFVETTMAGGAGGRPFAGVAWRRARLCYSRTTAPGR
jgi:hypothetical protein